MPGSEPRRHSIDSPRLLLRELPPTEARFVLDGHRPDEQRWAAGYPMEGTMIAAQALLDIADSGHYLPGFGMYQIIERDTGEVIGDIGFHSAPDENGATEIGYGIVPGFRGRGLASEALRTLCTWAFSEGGVRDLRATTDPQNLPSQHVLAAAGFTLVGLVDGQFHYRLLESEIPDRKS